MNKIAIIDDENMITDMLKKYLSKSFHVSTFNDSVDGLSRVKSDNFDLVLLDILMPRMDGIEVLEEIKKVKPDIKVVMMTAYSTLDRVLKSHKDGADNFIVKPFNSLSDVERKLNEVLKG
jgi:DNA-binding NtrC family response regulator